MFNFDNVSISSTVLTIQNCMHTCIHVRLSIIVVLTFLCGYVLLTVHVCQSVSFPCIMSCLPVRLYSSPICLSSVWRPVFICICSRLCLLVWLFGFLVLFSFYRKCLHYMSYHCLPFKTVTYGDSSALWHYRLIMRPSRMINVYWCINVTLRRYFTVPENDVSEVLSTGM
jgi:hypothetical protein